MICFSRDGKYAWCDTGEVFDAATKKLVAQWTDGPDGKGKPVMSSKFFEVNFKGKEPVWAGQQMGGLQGHTFQFVQQGQALGRGAGVGVEGAEDV